MTNLVNIPDFGDTKGKTPTEELVLAGIPVDGARVAEPLSHDEAVAAVAGLADAQANPDSFTTPVAAGDEDVYPGDFTPLDRMKLDYLYQTLSEAAPAIQKVIDFASSLTPEVQAQAQKTLGNPLVQRLMSNLLPKG